MTRRSLFAALAALALGGSAAAEPEFPPMHPKGFRVGDHGTFGGGKWRFQVAEVIDGKSAVVAILAYPDLPFLIRGFDTSKYADGSEVTIPGEWAVAGKEKRDGRTLFVVEPYRPAGRDKR